MSGALEISSACFWVCSLVWDKSAMLSQNRCLSGLELSRCQCARREGHKIGGRSPDRCSWINRKNQNPRSKNYSGREMGSRTFPPDSSPSAIFSPHRKALHEAALQESVFPRGKRKIRSEFGQNFFSLHPSLRIYSHWIYLLQRRRKRCCNHDRA